MNNRIYRSTSDQVIGGVAAGLARWLNIDPLLVRLGFVLGTFFTGGMLVLIYLLLWAVLPAPSSTATDVADIVRENVQEVAGRFRYTGPTTPQTGAPDPNAAPGAPVSNSAPYYGNGPMIVRALVIGALIFAALTLFGGMGWFGFGLHHATHFHSGGSFLWPMLLVLGALWFFRRRRRA